MFPVVSASGYCTADGMIWSILLFPKYSMYTYLDTDCIDRFYLSEDFDANLGELVDHIVWLSYFCVHKSQCNCEINWEVKSSGTAI